REGDISSELSHVITFDKIYTAEDLNEELAKLRRGYWSLILDTREFKKLLTSEGIQKLNRQISLTKNMEINYANIRMLLTAIYANRDDMLIDSIVNIFKRITQHHMNQYSSNIHYYNGWKTNDAYRINKKIIYPVSYGSFNPLRSEEHTSELQSRFDLVCRLLLEKKKRTNHKPHSSDNTSQDV